MLPQLCHVISTQARAQLSNCRSLLLLLRALSALAANALLDLTAQLHQLMPVVLTCLVAKRLGEPFRSIPHAGTNPKKLLASFPTAA